MQLNHHTGIIDCPGCANSSVIDTSEESDIEQK